MPVQVSRARQAPESHLARAIWKIKKLNFGFKRVWTKNQHGKRSLWSLLLPYKYRVGRDALRAAGNLLAVAMIVLPQAKDLVLRC